MPESTNFDRQYRMAAGPAGMTGFEIGATSSEQPVPLHIEFSLQKSDLSTQNTGKLSVWNLSPEHLSILSKSDCALSLRAGYGSRISLIFAGIVSYIKTSLDGADRKTEIEVIDSLIEVRDTYVSVSYNGVTNWKTIFDDVGAQMGVAVSYAYNAEFADVSNGFSFVGPAKNIITKGCDCCDLDWSIQNGVLQIKKPGDVMSREVYVLSPDTGLINIPARVSLEKSSSKKSESTEKKIGWEVEYLLNGAINIDDYVRLESKYVTGYFRVSKLEISGDNQSGDWFCKAQLLEVAE